MTTPVPTIEIPTGELREVRNQIGWIVDELTCPISEPHRLHDGQTLGAVLTRVDAALAPLLAAQEAVRRVEALIDPEAGMATGNGYDSTRLFEEKDIRAALAGLRDDRG